MRHLITASEIYPALKALLGLPEQCVSFELRARAGDVVTIACEYCPSLDAQGIVRLATVLREYELVARATPAAVEPHPAEVVGFDAWMRERTEAAHQAMMIKAHWLR